MSAKQNENKILRKRIKEANGEMPPTFAGMKFIRYVHEGNGFDAPFTWAIYISHDPCHDGGKFIDDRNTVIAVHRKKGIFKIIGRELDLKFATKLAKGNV